MDPPLVTFAIPAYNRPVLMVEAVESILKQTLSVDYEVVICDDGEESFEKTLFIEHYRANKNIRYFRNESPLGGVGNWNCCLQMARGTWVMVLHEDDFLFPAYLAAVIPRLRDGLAAVCTQTFQGPGMPPIPVPVKRHPAVMRYLPGYFLKSSMSPFPGVLIRRELAKKLNGFDENKGPLADYDFWYRLACAGPVEVVRTLGAYYRVAPGQWTERTWAPMLRQTHLLRLRIAREQFPKRRRLSHWMARFFTYRNALSYARRFKERPASLWRALQFVRIPFSRIPSGWVWAALKALSK